MNKYQPTQPPDVAWPDRIIPVQAKCPNCGSAVPKNLVLDVGLAPIGRERRVWRVAACPDCGCRFYLDLPVHDYADDEMLTRGRAALYLQQGAGLRQLCRPLALLQLPPGIACLEVGCGFGFALDFARHALGWKVRGIDPAQIAALGREQLNLPIESRSVDSAEPKLEQAFDVVIAAETLEHVPDPSVFLNTLRQALRPGGVLVLTTPDAAALSPETPPGLLAALLSPGLHCVFQTEASLHALLSAQGFTSVTMIRDGGRLVAHASTTEIPPGGTETFDPLFLAYLEDRALAFAPGSDLALGLAGRCLFESANAGDFDRAERMQLVLRGACLGRFGLDIETLIELPQEAAICTLNRMTELMPLNLAAILYASAMCALCRGAARSNQLARLKCAAEAAKQLQRAVGELGMADALSEDLAWVATAEVLLCEAQIPGADIKALMRNLPVLPGIEGAARHQHFTERLHSTKRQPAAFTIAALARNHVKPGLARLTAFVVGRLGRQVPRPDILKNP